ncbi:hypothetical protein HMI54_001721 [Coelomomyces lativittatus]|nr:hypothetical protein HMI55_001526 [Coelomomyces lativittatus]KAJ1510283.1 hypothetical protein HMI54_001721 [Coelomomyces lativittatus]KAJ1513285.1 hypothetical protein HMI56_002736 [Coelomomyces lativittatus]
MGKRKTARKRVIKAKPRLTSIFNCLYCNHEKSVEVKMNNEKKIGTIRCRVCQETWQTTINALSDPVDVYSDWIDACEAAQKKLEEEQSQANMNAEYFGDNNDDY